MQAELEQLRAGAISFREFERLTRPTWESFAKMLIRKWAPPPGFGVEDLVQEMLIQAWRRTPKWDPKHGKTLEQYVRFNAIDKAKKELQRQRNTLRRSDNAPPRVPYAFASLSVGVADAELRRDEESFIHAGLVRDPEYEVLIDAEEVEVQRREALGRAVVGLERVDGYLLVALAEANGDVTVASQELYNDAATRRRMRFNNEGQVRRAVRRALQRAAEVTGAAV